MPKDTAIAFSVGQMSHTGLVREKNEDSFGWFTLAGGELFIVADGMGGYAGGQEASKRTVLSFRDYFESHSGDPEDLLQESLLYADKKVQEIGQENPALSSCGSTIVAFLVAGNTGYFIHAGDSRLYVYSHGKLKQIGYDHSAVQEMLLAGVISAEEAEKAPKNVITQSLGGNIDISRCVVEKFRIENGSSYLLCSDGLWGSVPEDKLASIFAQAIPASSKVSLMVSAAIDAGGPDNITAQLIEFGEPVSQTQQIPERKGRHRFALIGGSVLLVLAAVFFGYNSFFSETESKSDKTVAGTEEKKPAESAVAAKPGRDAVQSPDAGAKTKPAEGTAQKGTEAVKSPDTGAKTKPAEGTAQKGTEAVKPSDTGSKTKPAKGRTQKSTDAAKSSDAGTKTKPSPGGKNNNKKTDKSKIPEK